MRHGLIDRPETDEQVAHFELCQRCRSALKTDIDIAAVRARVLAGLDTRPHPSAGIERRWMLAVAAAVVVAAVIIPFGLSNDGAPTLDQPELLPPDEPGTTVAPGSDTASDAGFEMEFSSGDSWGRLIWVRNDRYEAYRIDPTDSGPRYAYGFFRTSGSSWGLADPDNRMDVDPQVDDGPRGIDFARLDADIPWDIILSRGAVDDMWNELTGGSIERQLVAAEYPGATRAWAAAGYRLELNELDIPVLIDQPDRPRFQMTSLVARRVYGNEIGNNTDLPVDYALYLAPDSSPEQQAMLEDGIVTWSEYQEAVIQAAACSNVEPAPVDNSPLYDLSTITADCATRYVDDVAAVLTLDATNVSEDEFTAIWYTVESNDEAADMINSLEGERLILTEEPGWVTWISQRGPGYCVYSLGSSGCFLEADMSIPGILNCETSYSSTTHSGIVEGVVADDIDRLVITFTSGTQTELEPFPGSEFGFKAFGLHFDSDELGQPARIDVYDAGELRGTAKLEPMPGD